jgi:hypothetical protein
MTSKALDNLAERGQLKREAPDRNQINGLIDLAKDRLADLDAQGISQPGKFSARIRRRIPSHLPHCAGTVSVLTVDTWCFNACSTPWVSKAANGVFSIPPTSSGTGSSKKV